MYPPFRNAVKAFGAGTTADVIVAGVARLRAHIAMSRILANPATKKRLAASPARLLSHGSILIATFAAACGCDSPGSITTPGRGTAPRRQSASDELQRGLQFLRRLDEFDQNQAVVQATYHFNRWLDGQDPGGDWTPDELLQILPLSIREDEMVKNLGQLRFRVEDGQALLESVWARDVANWVSRQPTAGPLADAIEPQLDEMDEYEAEQLLMASRLFDWTTRHIQLDELLDYPAAELAVPGAVGSSAQQSSRPAPARAVPGPGYQTAPRETLLYGRGDALCRARVFSLLARQHNIDVVILAFPGQTTVPRPRPWLPAALIGQQLYLFDTGLGLPIPGPEGHWVATLEQALDDPELLSSLDVGDEYLYPVQHAELADVMVLIDAPPQALSRQTSLVEASLTGDDRIVLTVSPSALAERLKKCRGISDVFVWTVPFETVWYRNARQELINDDKLVAAEEYLRAGLFQGRTPLARARYLHFRAQFDKQGELPGAKMLYLQSRISQAQIDELEFAPEVQRDFGLERFANESDLEWHSRIAATKIMIGKTKLHASYWLGLALFDTGHYGGAVHWLKEQTLVASPDGPWTPGATYNLGRAYEAAGDVDEARNLYLLDRSHQVHGNLLRARLLREHSERPPSK